VRGPFDPSGTIPITLERNTEKCIILLSRERHKERSVFER
jgi:hypothetical protein